MCVREIEKEKDWEMRKESDRVKGRVGRETEKNEKERERERKRERRSGR